jgi:prepilin-type N-terminal cleavage/methylation domain-containing protein
VAGGFTLVEMILVLALLALIATVTITGASTIAQATGEADAESAVQTAIGAVRRAAVTSGQTLTLHATDSAFTWNGGQQDLPRGDTRVLLLPPVRDAAVLIGGQLSEEPITDVRFFPDGTCDAFRVQFKRKDASKFISIDPWTGATLQASPDQKS